MEFHILAQTPNGKRTKTIKNKTALSKKAEAECQEDSSFPADGHQAILNKMNKKTKTTRRRTSTDN